MTTIAYPTYQQNPGFQAPRYNPQPNFGSPTGGLPTLPTVGSPRYLPPPTFQNKPMHTNYGSGGYSNFGSNDPTLSPGYGGSYGGGYGDQSGMLPPGAIPDSIQFGSGVPQMYAARGYTSKMINGKMYWVPPGNQPNVAQGYGFA